MALRTERNRDESSRPRQHLRSACRRESVLLDLWQQANRLVNERGAYLAARRHRSLSPDATVRFVNVAELASVAVWRATLALPEFETLSAQMRDFHSNPGLFQVCVEDGTQTPGTSSPEPSPASPTGTAPTSRV